MNNFKPTRLFITSFYIASLISFNIFRLIPETIETWTSWVLSLFALFIPEDLLTNGYIWFSLMSVCLIITLLVRQFVIEPLGFYVNGKAAGAKEIIILGLLVFGYFIYSLNTGFTQYSMPEVFNFIRILLGDTFVVSESDTTSNVMSIIPWLWFIGPVAYMYYIFLKSEFSFAKQAKEKKDD